jgi:transposase
MTVSKDLRWRAIVLHHVYGIDVETISIILGIGKRSIFRWYSLFSNHGNVTDKSKPKTHCPWPDDVVQWVNEYVVCHPCFYVEELQQALRERFPSLLKTSASTICRVLHFKLKLTRKVLEKRAREASDDELQGYYRRLSPFYSHPSQLVFVDETSKDGRDALRKYAWSRRGTSAIVTLPFGRGERVSVLAALDCHGFFGWGMTDGTFDRLKFHTVMCEKIVPYLNPWPFPRSILILDNAKIHMYKELESLVHSRGALLFYLPPYSPQLNPIEVAFGLLKKWITRVPHAFRHDIQRTMELAMLKCTDADELTCTNLYNHCGYDFGYLEPTKFVM